MKQTWLCWFLKLILFACCLSSFTIFFFKDYFLLYLEAKTTFSSSYEKVKFLEFPTILACVKLGFKDDVMKKYNLESVYDFPEKDTNDVLKIFTEVSYMHGVDYVIWARSSPINFTKKTIKTFRHGKCYIMIPKEEIEVSQRVTLEIAWKDSKPKDMTFYLFSNYSWWGFGDDMMPYFQPSKFDLKLDMPRRLYIPISITTFEYMDGVSKYKPCIEKIIKNLDCKIKCVPYYLFKSSTLPYCNSYYNHKCIERNMYHNHEYVDQTYACHKPKSAKLFDPRPIAWKRPFGNTSIITFAFESSSVLHKDEIFVIGDLDFFSSICGSLGLFIGFSFYSCIIDFVQIVLQKFNTS